MEYIKKTSITSSLCNNIMSKASEDIKMHTAIKRKKKSPPN
jgi:hypothetical protein